MEILILLLGPAIAAGFIEGNLKGFKFGAITAITTLIISFISAMNSFGLDGMRGKAQAMKDMVLGWIFIFSIYGAIMFLIFGFPGLHPVLVSFIALIATVAVALIIL
ncbi:MAG: hypothetical protein HZB99_03735 [Candidatus Harrisonbacteria bacterium]|nr:hypothetical protein [Candidatus Harrisonbacteria bacterium]